MRSEHVPDRPWHWSHYDPLGVVRTDILKPSGTIKYCSFFFVIQKDTTAGTMAADQAKSRTDWTTQAAIRSANLKVSQRYIINSFNVYLSSDVFSANTFILVAFDGKAVRKKTFHCPSSSWFY